MTHEYKIAVLIPTRGRTDGLSRCVISLVNRAVDKDSIQLMFAFDNDDTVGPAFFEKEIQPWLDDRNIAYTALMFERMGYVGLNRYYNGLAAETDSDWLFGWSDDAIMETAGWDRIITKHTGEFKVLKAHAHNEHPYSIFPMWPRAWYDLFGHVSRHQMIDAEISQIAYMVDVMEIVDIYITHDRPDLTNQAADATHKERVLLEGNPHNPLDFHNRAYINARIQDAKTINDYRKSIGLDGSWFDEFIAGKRDPFTKMHANDINKQMQTIRVPG